MSQKFGWAWGFQDETWWSRFAQPTVSSWVEDGHRLHLVEQTKQADDPDPKALACYGLLVRWLVKGETSAEKMLLRFVNGRPVSEITIQFLSWCCQQIELLGQSVLVMIWDNARWHTSKAVRSWIREHNQAVKKRGTGVRLLVCFLPVKSPWLNAIEPKWAHGKRKIVEPNATLSKQALADRVCTAFDCPHLEHLAIPEHVS